MGILTVHLDRATNLKDEDTIGKSDPYFVFECEKDNFGPFDKTYGMQKSSVKQGDLNPVYDETFHFTVPNLDNAVLKIKVMDDDLLKDDKMGKAKIIPCSDCHCARQCRVLHIRNDLVMHTPY